MDNKKLIRRIVIASVLFVVGLYLTELSPFSMKAVALTNEGYGVLDMTEYDADVFVKMMNASTDISLYWKYYVCDFVFTAVFLNFMIQMVSGFKAPKIKVIKIVSYVLASIRGLLDIVENSIMLNQIYTFPNVNRKLINACNDITRIKFHFMRVWIVCFILMIVLERVSKRKSDNVPTYMRNQS